VSCKYELILQQQTLNRTHQRDVGSSGAVSANVFFKMGMVVHGTYLSVPFPSHSIAIYACPIPLDVSHGIPIGIPFPWTSLEMGLNGALRQRWSRTATNIYEELWVVV